MRLFLAINLPDDVRVAVHEATAPLRARFPRLGWVRHDLLHLTVKFLGEQEEATIPALVSAAAAVARECAPLAITLGGAGAFPNFRAPRVVWLGMRPTTPLEMLAERVDEALAPLGIARERRPFRAHLTFGRVRQPLPPAGAAELERELAAIRGSWRVSISRLDLMRSVLSSRGPTYSTLAALTLGRG